MKDTSDALESKYRDMLLERSGVERVKMGCSMHATAQALAKASLSQQHPGAHPVELKRLLFLHFYSPDFEPEQRKRIASALAKSGRHSEAQEPGKRTTRKPLELRKLAIMESSGSDAVREKMETYRKTGKRKANGTYSYERILNGAKRSNDLNGGCPGVTMNHKKSTARVLTPEPGGGIKRPSQLVLARLSKSERKKVR